MDKIRHAIQEHLDSLGDGWVLDQFVVCMGLTRVNSDGSVSSTPWLDHPANQPSWQTRALLHEAVESAEIAEISPE